MTNSFLFTEKGCAMSLRTRALAYGQALLHGLGGSAASIAIAGFCAVFFSFQLLRGAL